MISMDELCGYVRNYFLRDYKNPEQYIHKGTFTIADGSIQDLPFLIPGQYFRITGSALNDGVYKYQEAGTVLKDEVFNGAVWEMYVPTDFSALADEINTWISTNATALDGPYQSESFGGYSYSKGSSVRADGTAYAPWQAQFASRLSRYRRLSVL